MKKKKAGIILPYKKTCIIKWNNLKRKGGFYCLNCLHSFRTEKKLKSQEKVCKICNIL